MNGIIGTIRPQNYDSQSTALLGGFRSDLTGNRYVPQIGNDPSAGDRAGTGASALISGSTTSIVPFPTNSFLGWYHTVGFFSLWTLFYYRSYVANPCFVECSSFLESSLLLTPEASARQEHGRRIINSSKFLSNVHSILENVSWIVQHCEFPSAIMTCHIVSYRCFLCRVK